MRKFIDFLKLAFGWVSTDGLLHLLVCSLIILVFGAFMPLWAAVIIAIVIGTLKELYDLISRKGTPEWRDLICDIVGIIVGLLIAVLWLIFR